MRRCSATLLLCGAVLSPGCFGSAPVQGTDAGGEPPGETDGCGELVCSSGIHLSLVAGGDVFDAGQYDVTFVIDGEVEGCRFALQTGDACGLDPVCVVESPDGGCEGPQMQFNFVILPHTITFVVGPEADVVQVDVERDGQSILSQTLVPSYEDYAPNGPDCEPVCRVAQAQLQLQ